MRKDLLGSSLCRSSGQSRWCPCFCAPRNKTGLQKLKATSFPFVCASRGRESLLHNSTCLHGSCRENLKSSWMFTIWKILNVDRYSLHFIIFFSEIQFSYGMHMLTPPNKSICNYQKNIIKNRMYISIIYVCSKCFTKS
jgi:hypothetical protein